MVGCEGATTRKATSGVSAGSLERFYTVAFDFQIMRRSITFDRHTSKIDIEQWHDGVVPKCYRDRVAMIAMVVFEEFRGRPFGESTLDRFTFRLRDEVFNHLEPIHPSDVSQTPRAQA